MSEPIALSNKSDITKTGALRVACGGPAHGRHPKVYLTMVKDAKGQPFDVVCPYCSHVFLYDAKQATTGAAH